MTKTTVYLPTELKRALRRVADQRRCSEAALVREAVTRLTSEAEAPVPALPLFRATGPSIAEDVDRAGIETILDQYPSPELIGADRTSPRVRSGGVKVSLARLKDYSEVEATRPEPKARRPG